MQGNEISAERLSEVIAQIYDCTIDPDRWPATMGEICSEIGGLFSAIQLVDLENSNHQFFKEWNTDPFWMSKQQEYLEDLTQVYRSSPRMPYTQAVDEPLVLSRDIPEESWVNTRYYREWVKPQRIKDSLQTIVLQRAGRLGLFSMVRHESVGVATDRDIAILRLLAPHIRRAVTISDVIDLKAIELHALSETLDKFVAGVTVVAEGSRILHANAAARGMFAAGGPVRSVHGRLSAADPRARQELDEAVVLAQRDEAGIGAAGIGVALSGRDGEAAVAHVLPLARGSIRTRLMPQAAAAVFINQNREAASRDTTAVAKTLGLTRTEARMLEQLTMGDTLSEAAAALGIANTTAKTHLAHIFAKTGVSRQAELIALVGRLAPPVTQ
jgi:DNA-binding CsgD family transcriptional regulator